MIEPTAAEFARRDAILVRIQESVAAGVAIKLPPYVPGRDASAPFALVGIEPNDFGGSVGPFRYQFEGEDDLLHLFVTRLDAGPIEPREGQFVAQFALKNLSFGLVWFRPGHYSQHFYCGHDDLVAVLGDY